MISKCFKLENLNFNKIKSQKELNLKVIKLKLNLKRNCFLI
jgi:hypothetical protein